MPRRPSSHPAGKSTRLTRSWPIALVILALAVTASSLFLNCTPQPADKQQTPTQPAVRDASPQAPHGASTQPAVDLDVTAKVLTKAVGGKWTKRDKLMNLGPTLVGEVPATKGETARYIVVPFPFNTDGKAAIAVYVNSVAWIFDVLGSSNRYTVLVQRHTRGTNEAIISALSLRPCPVTDKAKARLKTLRGKRGSFRLLIHCPGGKGRPHQSLSLRAASGQETWASTYPTAHLSSAQVNMVITYLTYDGFLDDAVNIKKAAARHPGYDVCTLWVYDAEASPENIYVAKLGWGLETLHRLDGLRSVLYGDAGRAMDAFLANFAEQRRLCEKGAATQPALDLDATRKILEKEVGGTWRKDLHNAFSSNVKIIRGRIDTAAGKTMVRYNVFPFGSDDEARRQTVLRIYAKANNARILGVSADYIVVELPAKGAETERVSASVTEALQLKPLAPATHVASTQPGGKVD